jgi:hypothetical protein
LEKLFSEGYVINRVSYPPTSDGSASTMTQSIIIQFKPDVYSLLLLDIICLKLPVKSYFITAIGTNYESFIEEFFPLGF